MIDVETFTAALRGTFGAGGHQASAAEKRAAYEAYAALRNARNGHRGGAGMRNSLESESPFVRRVFGG